MWRFIILLLMLALPKRELYLSTPLRKNAEDDQL